MDGYLECYLALADAIVMQAVQDYRILCKRYKNRPDDWQIKSELYKCRKFFNSGWFNTLSGADGQDIAERIEKNPDVVVKKQVQYMRAAEKRGVSCGKKRERHAGKA